MARPDFLSPLHLYAPVDAFAAAGDEQSPNPQLLLNPNKSAMLIDQFRFSGAPFNVLQGKDLSSWDFMYLGIELRLGSIPITNGIVPISAIVPRYFSLGFLNPAVLDAVMTWHLPRPLYVPPGVQLYARFVRQDALLDNVNYANRSSPIENIGFSAVGRSMPTDYPVPKKIWVPWATATQCRVNAQTNVGGVLRFVSTDQELANPNTELLHVTAFNGFQCTSTLDQGEGIVGAPTHSPLTVQMTLSSDKMLMRDPTDFFAMFPADRGVFEVDAVLQSKEFVRAELELTPPAGAALADLSIGYATIGMIGYREVQTPIGVQP